MSKELFTENYGASTIERARQLMKLETSFIKQVLFLKVNY